MENLLNMGKFCMQNNQLPTKTPIEYSIVRTYMHDYGLENSTFSTDHEGQNPS